MRLCRPPPTQQAEIRAAIRDLCSRFPPENIRRIDEERGYPEEFVEALTKAGWLAALIPEEYGGSGLGLTEASVIMEEINRRVATPARATGRCTTWARCCATGRRSRSAGTCRKSRRGELRLQSMGVTEPTTGTDTTQDQDDRGRRGDRYVVNGQKVWISRVQHSDLMILLARTTPLAEVKKKSEGMSIFLVDLREAIGKGLTVRPIRTWSTTRRTSSSSTTSRFLPRT